MLFFRTIHIYGFPSPSCWARPPQPLGTTSRTHKYISRFRTHKTGHSQSVTWGTSPRVRKILRTTFIMSGVGQEMFSSNRAVFLRMPMGVVTCKNKKGKEKIPLGGSPTAEPNDITNTLSSDWSVWPHLNLGILYICFLCLPVQVLILQPSMVYCLNHWTETMTSQVQISTQSWSPLSDYGQA